MDLTNSPTTIVMTFENGRSRTVHNVPTNNPRVVQCPSCGGGIDPNCWMCVGVGLVYVHWITTKEVKDGHERNT